MKTALKLYIESHKRIQRRDNGSLWKEAVSYQLKGCGIMKFINNHLAVYYNYYL